MPPTISQVLRKFTAGPGTGPHHYNAQDFVDAIEPLETAVSDVTVVKNQAELARDLSQAYAENAISQGNVPVRASAESIRAETVPAGINTIRTNGRFASNDGGGAVYARSASSSPGSIADASGAHFRPISAGGEALPLKVFGAAGNGTTDDTQALQDAFASGLPLIITPGSIHRFLLTLNVQDGARIFGSGGKLAYAGSSAARVINVGNYVQWEDMFIRLQGNESAGPAIKIGSGLVARRVELETLSGAPTSVGTMIEMNPSGCRIDRMSGGRFARPFVFQGASETDVTTAGEINYIKARNYIRALKIDGADDLTIFRVDFAERNAGASKQPGHNGILMSSCRRVSILGGRIEDAGEHAIRIAAITTLSQIEVGRNRGHRFSGLAISNPGGCHIKLNAGDDRIRDTVISDCVLTNNHTTSPGGNSEAIRITGAANIRISNVSLNAPDSTSANPRYSAQHFIRLNDVRGLDIKGCSFQRVWSNIVRIDDSTDDIAGPVEDIYIDGLSGRMTDVGGQAFVTFTMPTASFGAISIDNCLVENLDGPIVRYNNITGGATDTIFVSGDFRGDDVQGFDGAPNSFLYQADVRFGAAEYNGRQATAFSAFANTIVSANRFDPADTRVQKAGILIHTTQVANALKGLLSSALLFTRPTGASRLAAAIASEQTGAAETETGLRFFVGGTSGGNASDNLKQAALLDHRGRLVMPSIPIFTSTTSTQYVDAEPGTVYSDAAGFLKIKPTT